MSRDAQLLLLGIGCLTYRTWTRLASIYIPQSTKDGTITGLLRSLQNSFKMLQGEQPTNHRSLHKTCSNLQQQCSYSLLLFLPSPYCTGQTPSDRSPFYLQSLAWRLEHSRGSINICGINELIKLHPISFQGLPSPACAPPDSTQRWRRV